jgi:iron complex transport system ATP-binding protein
MLRIENLSVAYGKTPILHNIGCHMATGTLTAIIGPNGSGKTTLLRCLLGLLPVSKHKLFVNGEDLWYLSAGARARRIAYIPQDNGVHSRISVFDAVLLGRKPFFNARPAPEDLAQAERVIEEFGLAPLALRTLDTLSGGQRQLVWTAKAICQDTPLIVLDEPTSNLDIKHSLETGQLLQALAQQGKTIVLVSHDLALCKRFCTHALLLKEGQIVNYDRPANTSAHLIANLFDLPAQTLGNLW